MFLEVFNDSAFIYNYTSLFRDYENGFINEEVGQGNFLLLVTGCA